MRPTITLTGQIINLLGGFYYVKIKRSVFECRARGLMRLNEEETKPVVGDFVKIQVIEHNAKFKVGYIIEVLKRINKLIRPKVANIEQGLIINSVKEPKLSTYLVNKFIITLTFYNIDPILIFTKRDLVADQETWAPMLEKINWFKQFYPTFIISNVDHSGFYGLKKVLNKKTNVFIGQTGVGKSSTINHLDPQWKIKTAAISKSLGRGKHTTRDAKIYDFNGGQLIDCPGFSAFDLDAIPSAWIALNFYSFSQFRTCKFQNCLHIKEPKCGVKTALLEAQIPQFIYDDYLKIISETNEKKEVLPYVKNKTKKINIKLFYHPQF